MVKNKKLFDIDKLANSVRCVGTLKPTFNIETQNFLPPQLKISGTGFWVDEGIFITCAHVIKDILEGPLELVGMLVVGGNKDQYLKAIISIVDYEHDLAVLQILDKNFHSNMKSACLEVSDVDEPLGSDVHFAGYPLGNQLLNEDHTPIYSKGVVAHKSSSVNKLRKEIKISGSSVVGGFSGSPVVNNEGKVIGVITSHPQQTQSIFNIISWEHVSKLIDLENS